MVIGVSSIYRKSLELSTGASGHNSTVEYELPKLGVAGSNPVARSFFILFYFEQKKMAGK
jgi:hypothetical protein